MSEERSIRIAQYYSPPYDNACQNMTCCDFPGIETSLLMMKLMAMNFRLEFVTFDVNYLLNAIKNGSADITASTYPLISYYYNGLCPTNSVINDKALLVVKLKQVENRNLLFSMCDIEVWLLLFCVLALILGVKILAGKLNVPRRQKSSASSSSVDPLPKIDAAHAGWGIIFTIIFYTYTSFLAIIFSQKLPLPLPFKSFKSFTEQLANGMCRLYTNESTISDIPDLLPRGPMYSEFMNAVYRAPILSEPDERSLIDKILSGDCNVGLIYKSERPIYEDMSCNLQFVDFDEFPTISYVFYYRCDYPHYSPLSNLEASTDYYETAMKAYAKHSFIEKKMYENSVYLKTDCFDKHGHPEQTTEVESLKLWQLADSFLLLMAGIFIGGLIHVATQYSENVRRLFSYFGDLLQQNKF